MPTPEQIETQMEFERNQIREGIEKLRANTKKLEDKSYASATAYGSSSIAELLPHMVKHLRETSDRITKRHNGRLFKELKDYIFSVDYEVTALITLKTVFDQVFSNREKADFAINVSTAIGQHIEDECQMMYYEDNYPGLYNAIKKKYWHNAKGTSSKVVATQTLMHRIDDVIEWKRWDSKVKLQLGGWLLDAVLQISGWFKKTLYRDGKKTILRIAPTEEFMRVQHQIMDIAEVYSPLKLPMLIEPKDWEAIHEGGGYYLNQIRQNCPMVRRGKPSLLQGAKPIAALNKIQRTSYKLNEFVADVAEILEERRYKVGKFVPIQPLELPPKPADIAENYDSRKEYRRRAAEAHDEAAQSFRSHAEHA